MRGWPLPRPTHAPATTLKTNSNSAPPTKPKTPRAVTLWRHACLTTPVVKPSPPQPPSVQPQKNSPKQKPPRAAAPAAACVAGRSTGQHMPPQQALKTNGNNAPPPHKTKNPSCRHSVAACVSDHSRGQALAPATALSPTAKEFPKTKTSSCCRSRGGMRGWPVHRPTHAPATSPQNKRQQRPPPTKPKTPRAVTLWRHACLTTPVVKPSPPQPPSVQPQKNSPKQKPPRAAAPEHVKQSPNPPLTPRAAAPAAACVAGRSTGQHMLPQQALKTNGNNAPHKTKKRILCRSQSPSMCPPNPPLTPRAAAPEPVKESPSDIGATSKEKNNIVIPEFSAWLTLVLEQCRAENIRNLPRQRAPTPLFPERRPREACSMPISGCHDLPLATFNLPSRVFRHGCRRAECLERRWGGFFHTLSRGGMRVQCAPKPPAVFPSLRLSVSPFARFPWRLSGVAPKLRMQLNPHRRAFGEDA